MLHRETGQCLPRVFATIVIKELARFHLRPQRRLRPVQAGKKGGERQAEGSQEVAPRHDQRPHPIFERIFARVKEDGDDIIAYIAYGLYKERKRDFLIARQEELGGPVPQAEIDTFHRTYDEGQINLIWKAASDSLAEFAVTYSDAEKQAAVNAGVPEN
jgi:hypothetical protein